MKINIARFELCAFRQHLCSQFRFERAQTIYLVGKKNEELEIIADVGKANGNESLALRVAEMPIHLPHHRNIDRSASRNVKRLRRRRLLRKWIGPRRLEIKRIREDEPCRLIQCAGGNEIANPVTSLIGDPFIDVLGGSGDVGNEIDWLKR